MWFYYFSLFGLDTFYNAGLVIVKLIVKSINSDRKAIKVLMSVYLAVRVNVNQSQTVDSKN